MCHAAHRMSGRRGSVTNVVSTLLLPPQLGHCGECGAYTQLRAQGRFCDDDCARRARDWQTLRAQVAYAACVYQGCGSGARIRLDGRFCSAQCRERQMRVDARRNRIIQEGVLDRRPLEHIMREVNAIRCDEAGKK